MNKLFLAAVLALALHLLLFTVRFPIVRSSSDEPGDVKVISVRIIHSEPERESVKDAPHFNLEKDVHLEPVEKSAVEEQNIASRDTQPLPKYISKGIARGPLPGAPLKASKQKRKEPAKDPEKIPSPPSAPAPESNMAGDTEMPHEKATSSELSLEDTESRDTQQTLAHAQPPQVLLRSEVPVLETRPDYLLNPTPEYPALARKRGYEGVVFLEVLVDEKGFPADIKIAESSGHAILDNAAAKAVATWKFEPARKGNIPMPMNVKVPVLFKLD